MRACRVMPGKRVSPRWLIFVWVMLNVTHVTKRLLHTQAQNEMNVTFSDHLAELMQLHGWSAAELARRSGLSHVAIANYVKGRTPRYSEATKLAAAFGVAPDFLLNPSVYRVGFERAAEAVKAITDPEKKAEEYNRLVRADLERIKARQEGWEAASDVVREDPPWVDQWRDRALAAEALLDQFRELLDRDKTITKKKGSRR
ncbi:MAG: XRE family transcriptional regulator [Hyphomicrobiaceae bacterium]|nr:MAG: XRE family transcriptional regulator [Hyphomicrobiaceae bacterium]